MSHPHSRRNWRIRWSAFGQAVGSAIGGSQLWLVRRRSSGGEVIRPLLRVLWLGVLAAGQLELRGDGKVTVVDSKSRHYLPAAVEAARYPAILRYVGLVLSQAKLQGFRFHIDNDGFFERSEKLS